MKFTTAIVAASVVAAANALQITNPQAGSVWVCGQKGYLTWIGDCTAMGNSSHAVKVQLMAGDANALEWKADLGTIDCSNSTDIYLPVPTIDTGKYSIQILTTPATTYSNQFTVNNPAAPSVAPTTAAPAPSATPDKPNAGNMVAAGSMTVAFGAVVAALQFIL